MPRLAREIWHSSSMPIGKTVMKMEGISTKRGWGGRDGFTLMELLVVTVIIAILAAMLTGALFVALRNAQRKQRDVQINTLTTAIEIYRHEYSKWPGWEDWGFQGQGTVAADNYEIIEYLVRPEGASTKNPRRVQFLNLSEYITNAVGSVVSPVTDNPYSITIDMDNDRCSVAEGP